MVHFASFFLCLFSFFGPCCDCSRGLGASGSVLRLREWQRYCFQWPRYAPGILFFFSFFGWNFVCIWFSNLGMKWSSIVREAIVASRVNLLEFVVSNVANRRGVNLVFER